VLEPTSQHPRYQFAAGLLQIEIQDQTGTASIQTPVSQMARLPADPEPLAQWLALGQEAHAALALTAPTVPAETRGFVQQVLRQFDADRF